MLCCISKILKNESNSQRSFLGGLLFNCCVVSQRYWKMKAIHNWSTDQSAAGWVVLYLKDTEKWKQFTTTIVKFSDLYSLCCISKILKNESNSQLVQYENEICPSCVVSQRYWKMKAIYNLIDLLLITRSVVLYLKDTEKWKQFTTKMKQNDGLLLLCCISKIQKNESNSQLMESSLVMFGSCVVSQRYRKTKAIHNDCK